MVCALNRSVTGGSGLAALAPTPPSHGFGRGFAPHDAESKSTEIRYVPPCHGGDAPFVIFAGFV